MAKRNAISPDYRRAVALRCLAAVTGGFAATSALCILLALLLIESGAMPRGEAPATATGELRAVDGAGFAGRSPRLACAVCG